MNFIQSYFIDRINDLNEDYTYNPLSKNDIQDLIYKFQISNKLNTTHENYIKYKDCEFFNSNDNTKNTPSTFECINKCHSISGTEIFKNECANTTNNIDILNYKQSLIREINLNYVKLDTYLIDFKNIENGIYWHLKDKTQEFNDVCDTLYFKSKWLKCINNSQWILSTYYFFLIIWTPLWGILGPVIFLFIPYFFTRFILKMPIPFNFYWKQLTSMLFGSQFFTMFKIIKEGFKLMRGTKSASIQDTIIDIIFNIIVSPIGRWLYFLIIILGYFWTITNSIMTSWNTNKFTNFIHNRMNEVSKLFDIYSSIRKITKLSLKDILGDNYKLKNHNSKYWFEHQFILDILYCENIKDDCGFTKMKGGCLSTYWKLKNNTQEELDIIICVIKYIGIIDSIVSQCKLINKYNFTFTEYINNSKYPKIKCKGIFNPVLTTKCVKNDISLYNEPITSTIKNINQNDKTQLDNPITQLDNPITQLDNPITQLDNPITQLDDSITQLDVPITQLDDKDIQIDDKDIQIDDSITQLDDKDIQLDNKDIQIDDRMTQLDDKNIQLDDKNIQIEKNENKQNCILTGPNGSGKSSLLKNLLVNIILSQSLGITPADKVKLTPFKYISSYLNIADSQGKESLFQAEMTRCHNHLLKLKQLEDEKVGFSFNIMDEIFVSTNYYEGVSGAYAVIKNLEKYKNSINIITTHFDILTRDEFKLPSYTFKYFTIKNNGDKDYQLRNGVNKKHCALGLLKDKGFDKELCENANDFYIKLKQLEN